MTEIGEQVSLVAVSKMQSVEAIRSLYLEGHRDFGENYVQELVSKQMELPSDIRWHFIGHLQSNKVKYIAPFIHLIQSVDSFKLLREIERQGEKFRRQIRCLLQVHVAREETKFGLSPAELDELVAGFLKAESLGAFRHVCIRGLMGMASNTDDASRVRAEFKMLSALYDKYASIHTRHFHFKHLSMGMSGDYRLAISEGSTMIRIGTMLFGARTRV